MLGAVAAAAGLFAAVAPMLEWFEVTAAMDGVEATATTTGWGSTGVDAAYSVSDTVSWAWDGWAIAAIPDGVLASLLGVIILLIAGRLAVGSGPGRRTPRAAVVTGVGVLGLVWMVVSWFSANRMVADTTEALQGLAGVEAGALDDLLTLGIGPGFIACAAAFAVATLCGLGALWSGSSDDARRLDERRPDPTARPLQPKGYVPPPNPIDVGPPRPVAPAPPAPPDGWL